MGHPNDPFLGHPPTGRSFCLAVTQRPWFFGSNDLHGVAGVCWQGHRDRTISLVPDGPKPEPHIATAWLLSHVLQSIVQQGAATCRCPGPCNARRRYGSSRCRAPPRASRESAARSDRSTSPGRSQHLLHLRHRHSMGRRLASSPLDQSILAELFVALPPTPHMPITDADDLGSLCHQVIFLAKACKITSCAFIARSTAAFE